MKLLLGGALSVGHGPLLDEVVGLAERWLSMVGSSLGVGVLGMDYGDFEVAREVVKVMGRVVQGLLQEFWTTP